jgi:hypothetical protein
MSDLAHAKRELTGEPNQVERSDARSDGGLFYISSPIGV